MMRPAWVGLLEHTHQIPWIHTLRRKTHLMEKVNHSTKTNIASYYLLLIHSKLECFWQNISMIHRCIQYQHTQQLTPETLHHQDIFRYSPYSKWKVDGNIPYILVYKDPLLTYLVVSASHLFWPLGIFGWFVHPDAFTLNSMQLHLPRVLRIEISKGLRAFGLFVNKKRGQPDNHW